MKSAQRQMNAFLACSPIGQRVFSARET